jgi:hypothetical protein
MNMLYDLVAEHFGVENDNNLQAAVDASGVSALDCMDDDGSVSLPSSVIPKLVDALNVQTDRMIEAEIERTKDMPLTEILMEVGVRVRADDIRLALENGI